GGSEREANNIARQIVAQRDLSRSDRSGAAPRPTQRLEADGSISDVRQLLQIPAMPPEWVTAVEPLTTVYGSEAINPLTAPAGVIAALPGIDPARLESFLSLRRVAPADFEQLQAVLGPARLYLENKPQSVVSVSLEARLLDGFAASA